MTLKTEMTEQRWLDDFEKWSLGTENSATTKRIYDALKASGQFQINYSKSDFQSRAHFLIPWMHPNFELIRATIHVDNPTKKKEEAWLNKDRAEDWPAEWKEEFKEMTGMEPGMGKKTIRWCLQDPANVDQLVEWLISKAQKPDD